MQNGAALGTHFTKDSTKGVPERLVMGTSRSTEVGKTLISCVNHVVFKKDKREVESLSSKAHGALLAICCAKKIIEDNKEQENQIKTQTKPV